MGKKKSKPTQSQISGISWIAMVLVVIIGLYLFSKNPGSETTTVDAKEHQSIEKLEKMEDSACRSRRPQRPKYTYRAEKQHSDSKEKSNLYTTEPPAPLRKPLTVELNDADTLTLQLLHGIGPAYASRIVHYREKLGGFTSTDQLLEIYGFTPELLAHIESYLALDTTHIRRISINSVSLKALARHPYIEYYQARDIVRLRNKGVVFSCADDLRTVPSMADSTLQRMLPYLDFSEGE